MAETSCTESMMQIMRATSLVGSEKELLDMLIRSTLGIQPGGGWVDSHKITRGILARREDAGYRNPTFEQTRDYVQHLFREAEHVCRHADGHYYRIHMEKVCSPECDEVYAQNPKIVRRPSCQFCFLEVTTSGNCPIGCE